MNKNWIYKKIGDLFETGAGGTPLKSRKEFYDGGTIPWLLSGEVNQRRIKSTNNFITPVGYKNSSARLFPKDTVLIAMYGATAGQVGVLKIEATTNQAVCGILPNKDILPDFLYFYFLSIKNELVTQAVGNAQPNLSQIKIKNTKIPIPPLPEQQRIVEILDQSFAAIDQAIENTEKNSEYIIELSNSYQKALLDDSGNGWIKTSLEFITKQITDGKHGDCRNEVNSGYYFLSAKDVKNGFLNYDNARQINKDDFEETNRRTNLEPGDLLITNSGTIGRMAIAKNDSKTFRTTFQKSVAILKIKPGIIESELLMRIIQNDLDSLTKKSEGTAQKNLLLRDIRTHPISFPKSRITQRDLLEQLFSFENQITNLLNNYQKKLEKLQELKQSILHKAFNGEL